MNNDGGVPRFIQDYIQELRQQRKAALRECGRLGEKLHAARLEIENQRHRIKELEDKLQQDAYKEVATS
jgi:uncharacterized protein involved in exopolysaccharide biosynthesis